MLRLKTKLALFNLISKLSFTALFLLFMPFIAERINLRQIDNILIEKREDVLDLISEIGIEPFIASDSSGTFGSYNILKEEYISLERIQSDPNANFINVSRRIIDSEEIDYRVLNYSVTIDDKHYLLEVGKSLSSIEQTETNTRKVIFLFVIFIILLTFLTDFQYTRLLLRPLDKIRNKLKGISDPSIFDRNPVVTTTDDFHNLDKALRELMENIDRLFRKEKEITVNVSHELLTPVSVLRSRFENFLLRKELPEEMASWAGESLRILHRMQSLVNSLLFIARIESHQYLRNESFNPEEILEEIIEEVEPLASENEQVIIHNKGISRNLNRANRTLIFSMFSNIVRNSINNTGRGGEITISGQDEGELIIVSISDTGTGMTREQLDTIFMRFRSGKSGSEKGTGIGLAIAKSIADFHGIEIKVSSKLSEGTTFLFRIPVNS